MCLAVIVGGGVPANADVRQSSVATQPNKTSLAATAWLIGNWYGASNAPDHYCINNPKASTANNVQQIIYSCINSSDLPYPNGKWYLDDSKNPGHYNIRNYQSGKCLTIQSAHIANNQPIIQYTCNLGSNEVWIPDPTFKKDPQGFDMYNWTSEANTSYCLTVQNASTANGAKLILYRCNFKTNQNWTWWVL